MAWLNYTLGPWLIDCTSLEQQYNRTSAYKTQYAAIATLSSTTHPLPWAEHRTSTHTFKCISELRMSVVLGVPLERTTTYYQELMQLVFVSNHVRATFYNYT